MYLRRVKKIEPSRKLRIYNEQTTCNCCGERLSLRSTTERNITNLVEKVKLSVQVGYCQTEGCKYHKMRLRPVSYQTQIIPRSGYGIDVYGLIGALRFESHQTISEIARKLELDYAHIEIKERHIENIINQLELYISESGKNSEHLKKYYAKREQTELLLSADGIQPEQGHNTLYIIREIRSGKVLYAHYSTHSDEEHLKSEIFAPLQSLLAATGLQVGGWIVDKELALSKAIVSLYPDTPLQHCQSHFLGALKKPLTKTDTELGKSVKKNFGKLRPLERQIQQSAEEGTLEEPKKEYLQNLCSTIRNWQGRSLAHKHRLKGVELYETMEEIRTIIPILRSEQDHEVLKQLQINLDNSVAGLEDTYEALKQGKQLLDQVTDVLYGAKDAKRKRNSQQYRKDTDAKQVKEQLEDLLLQNKQAKEVHSPVMEGYLKHFQKTYHNWSAHLFTCYNHPDIPNDNNRIELSHSQMKKERRRTTGHSNTARYLKIHGEQAAFTLNFGQQPDVQEVLKNIILQTDKEQFGKERQKQKIKSQQRGKTMATKHNLTKLLKDMVENWGKSTNSG